MKCNECRLFHLEKWIDKHLIANDELNILIIDARGSLWLLVKARQYKMIDARALLIGKNFHTFV